MTKNLTVGSPALLIISFTLPLLVGNLFQQFYNMADTFIVGRTIGVAALAAVGCTGSLMFLIQGFVMGFTSGTAIITAQRFGASDSAGVRRSFVASIILGGGVTLCLMILSIPFTGFMLSVLRTPAEIFEDAYAYIVVIFWGMGAVVLFNILSNVMRAVGDSVTPLVFLIIACVINIVLDYLFILVFHAGTAGAAYATVIAQIVSGLLCIFFIMKKMPLLKIRKEDWRCGREELWAHLRVALPMGFQMSIIAIGAVILQFALNGLGTAAVAAFTAAQKIDMTATLPLSSFGITMATYTAQNYGARRYDRIKKGVLQCSLISGSFSILMGILFVFAGRRFAAIFVGADSHAVELAYIYLVTNGSCYVILALLFIFRQTLQGLGDSLVPTIAGIMELVMRCLAVLLLSVPFGFTGICWASPLAWIGSCIPLAAAFGFKAKQLSLKALAVRPGGSSRPQNLTV
jgi:putative MATE family efflux protein